MGSLARLTVALPSIAIPEIVSRSVDETLEHLKNTCNALKDGRFTAALDNAKIAETAAERGFFEKSMVGQVYFPDEHKVAVYLPLLGPVGVPLVMSALKEIKRIWMIRRSKRDDQLFRVGFPATASGKANDLVQQLANWSRLKYKLVYLNEPGRRTVGDREGHLDDAGRASSGAGPAIFEATEKGLGN
ncbi:MAG: hypothetical protein L6R41_000043 [Letrouitia leprolyta]|nr:MAG: hypothetical protein L6R41_000043 [Letrouitia leprolyta]